MQFYSLCALVPAVVGVAMYALRSSDDTVDTDPYLPFFSVFMSIWAVLFLVVGDNLKIHTHTHTHTYIHAHTHSSGDEKVLSTASTGIRTNSPTRTNFDQVTMVTRLSIRCRNEILSTTEAGREIAGICSVSWPCCLSWAWV